ncbi:MAG: glycosyltransferase [Alphaproteobacteria bacterium]|uniref:Glycosyltransferase n=1 Tax=Candidatus Nitrobium versatile TaxID=2884831 RepID=A0A953J3N1_9BACT|nr:glycosyltransferase [Candidatus Nitrobium versatile]
MSDRSKNIFSNGTLGAICPIRLRPLPPKPLVSIIVANFNYGLYIGSAIESVQAQTYSNFELIICDDGSTDGSCEVIGSYLSRDKRINFISKENGGQASAFNTAYKAANGEIICFLDSDDLFHEHKLEWIVGAFQRNTGAGYCTHLVQPISPDGRFIESAYPKSLENGWIACDALFKGGKSIGLPPTSGLSFRKEITDKIFPIPPDFRVSADGPFREAAQFMTSIIAIPEILAYYRIHRNNSRGLHANSLESVRAIIADYEKIHIFLKEFLRKEYGEEVAKCLRLEDAPQYWENLIKISLFTSKGELNKSYSMEEILREIPFSPRKIFWRIMSLLPESMAKPALRFFLGDSRRKRILLRTIRALQIEK